MDCTVLYKSELFTASTIKSKSLVSHAQDGLDLLHVLVLGHVGLAAVGPVLVVGLHDGVHGEDGVLGDAGLGNNRFTTRNENIRV